MEYIQPRHLYTRLLENAPWKSGDPNAKGDPRKSVKWIDVRLFSPTLLLAPSFPIIHVSNLLSDRV